MGSATPTWCFALVLVKRGHRFLLVHERKHGGGWYFPAGRLEAGETFAEAAVRETREEAGVEIVLEGILKLQHTPAPPGGDQRFRVFFLARQADDAAPKQQADEHSQEAAWFTLEELRGLPLRGDEVEAWVRFALEHPAQLLPLSALAAEVP
jgi:phosphatase NudJ